MQHRQTVVLAAALVAAAWTHSQAVPTELEVSIEPKVSSAFVWRGQVISDEWSFQPTVSFQASNLTIKALGNWELSSDTNASEHTRVDTTLDYSAPVGPQLWSAGFVAYLYQHAPSDSVGNTYEVYVRDVIDVFLLPSLTVYYDLSQIKGFYGSFSLARSFDLVKDMVAMDVKVALGAADGKYNRAVFSYPEDTATGREAFDADKTSLVDLTASVSFPFWPADNVTITPAVKYMNLLDSDLRNAANRIGKDTDIFYYSLALEYKF